MINLNFITACWGFNHRELFVDICIPSMIASNNLPAMKNLPYCVYHILTKADDILFIENSNSFKLLSQIIKIKIEIIDDNLIGYNPHQIMSICHRIGLDYAFKRNAASVFIPPDTIWSNNSFVNMEHIFLNNNFSRINIAGLRIIKEEISHKISFIKNKNTNKIIELSSSEMVDYFLPHLHPITKDHFFNEESSNLMPANLLWNINNQGILAHCFHLHPLLIPADKNNSKFKYTIDDDIAVIYNNSISNDYIVQDSDQILCFEISPLTHKVLAGYRKGFEEDVAAWAEYAANLKHREFVNLPIRIHNNNYESLSWNAIESNAKNVINLALYYLSKSNLYLFLNCFKLHNNLSHRFLFYRDKYHENNKGSHFKFIFSNINIWFFYTLFRILMRINNLRFIKFLKFNLLSISIFFNILLITYTLIK